MTSQVKIVVGDTYWPANTSDIIQVIQALGQNQNVIVNLPHVELKVIDA